MEQPLDLPKFTAEQGLASFLADLRAWSFSSQVKAARAFGLAHTTVSRYEGDQIVPPVEYLCALAHLAAARRQEATAPHMQVAWLKELNRAVHHCYPDQPLFLKWEDIGRLAVRYIARQHKATGVDRRAMPATQPMRGSMVSSP